MLKKISIPILHRYLAMQFLVAFFGSLFAFVSLFLMFDLFDRSKTFIKEETTIIQIFSYVVFKFPLIVHLMTPLAMLIATLFSVARLSQTSEVTAMRSCGVSLLWILRPLIALGVIVSAFMFLLGETVVPSATYALDELYHVDIKKKAETGTYSRENFWYRVDNTFYNVALYDSRSATLKDISVLTLDRDFKLARRVDAAEAFWQSGAAGWVMRDATEMSIDDTGSMSFSTYRKLPLVISERPKDFYNMQRSPESMSYLSLRSYIEKLASEGVPTTKYVVDLAAKLSFPLVNLVLVIIAFPFALTPARSRTVTLSFIAGISIGFGYYFVHAFALSLGSAEMIPVIPAAWTANLLFACIGGFLISGAEQK